MSSPKCPVCGYVEMRRVHLDGEPGQYVEEVWVGDDDCPHEVVISYGRATAESVRDTDGDEVPEHEWGYTV